MEAQIFSIVFRKMHSERFDIPWWFLIICKTEERHLPMDERTVKRFKYCKGIKTIIKNKFMYTRTLFFLLYFLGFFQKKSFYKGA
jgi:hypothetical protein